MTAAPVWMILVPTLGERRRLFERLMAGLLPQVERAAGQVIVRAWHNNGSPSLPEIRQRMLAGVTAPYVCFVDDDDLVSPDYVDAVLEALSYDPDYVGFLVQCYSDGIPTGIADHDLTHKGWSNVKGGRYLRDISHINPIRTLFARTADFTRARRGGPEDRIWVDQLRASGLLEDQVKIDRILYHYLYSTSRRPGEGSRWAKPGTIRRGEQAEITSPYFTWVHDLRAEVSSPYSIGSRRG